MPGNEERIKALSDEQSEKLIGKDIFRKKVIEIICEHVGTVDFMKKVWEYAGLEIDRRTFKSFRYWATLIITAVITSGIGFLFAEMLQKK